MTAIEEVWLRKGEQFFVWRFRNDQAGRAAALDGVCRFAADGAIPLSWLDAARIARLIRRMQPTEPMGKIDGKA